MSDFQGYVSYLPHDKPLRKPIISVITVILFFIFLAVVFACLVSFKKVEKCYERQVFYVVYIEKNRRKIDEDKKELIKKLGGAGSVLFFKEEYFLVANVYLNEADATEIKENLKESFSGAGVVKLEAKAINKKTASHIAQNLSYSRFFERYYKFINDFEQVQIEYLKGEIGDGDFSSKLLKTKLEFQDLIDLFENPKNEKIFEDITTYANMLVNYFDEFFNKFFQSGKKESLICELKFNFARLKVDMFNNLQ